MNNNREDMMKLLALLDAEEATIERGKLDRYVPHRVQLAFHKSQKKVRALIGGNRPLAYGTMVRMADGDIKKIEDIAIGDFVLGFDGAKTVSAKVIDIPFDEETEIWEYVTRSGEKIRADETHEFPMFLSQTDMDSGEHRDASLREIQNSKWEGKRFLDVGIKYKKWRNDGLVLSSIVSVGTGRARCIKIDLQSHIFVLANGILTKNSGKTTANTVECLWTALGCHPYYHNEVPCRIKMYGDSFPTVMETFVPKFDEWCPSEYLLPRKPYEYNQAGHVIGVNFRNGSHIKIGSYDQEERKAEGSKWDLVSFDEPPTRELYVANLRGLIDTGGRMIFSLTPLSQPWIYDDIYVPSLNGTKDYIECFQVKSDENPHINHQALKLFLDELTEEEKEIRFEGKFAKLTGLVIDTYSAAVHDVDEFDFDEGYVIYEGIDPHPMKPHCALWKAVDRDGIRFVADELSFTGGLEDFGKQLVYKRAELTKHGAKLAGSCIDTIINTKDMSNRINQKDELNRGIKKACIEIGRHELGMIPSSAIKMDQLNPGIQKIKDLYRKIFSEQYGHEIIQQYVFKKCKKYKYELGHYQWPDGAHDGSKPKNKDDDYIACERYLESLAPRFHTPGSGFIRNNNDGYKKLSQIERGIFYGERR